MIPKVAELRAACVKAGTPEALEAVKMIDAGLASIAAETFTVKGEGTTVFTAASGSDFLKVLLENQVHRFLSERSQKEWVA